MEIKITSGKYSIIDTDQRVLGVFQTKKEAQEFLDKKKPAPVKVRKRSKKKKTDDILIEKDA